MSFEPPDGILDIGNATLRVGKLEVAETSGLNQGLQNIVKNDLLVTENTEYSINHHWGLKLPTTWVAEFDVKGHSTTKYVEFNFYNEGFTSNTSGYTLNFNDTTLSLRYDNGSWTTATIPTIVGAYRKVNIFFERNVIAVSIDGTRVLYYKHAGNPPPVMSRVISTTGSAFVNVFIEQDALNSKFKNLRIVNGRFISDQTSNIAFVGGNLGVGVNSPQETLDIRGNMHLNRVSNVSSISVDSNVVTEYTGPHDRPLRKYPEVAMTANDNSSTSGYVASTTNVDNSSVRFAFNAFIDNFDRWQTGGNRYASGGIHTAGETFNDIDGNPHLGDWIQLQLPTKINLSRVDFWHHHTAPSWQPQSYVILGSNDGSSWKLIYTQTNSPIGELITEHLTTAGYFKYFRLVVKSLHGHTDLIIRHIQYYGHEEGSGSLDTTLKTVYNVPATTGTQLEVYYDGQDYTQASDFTGTGGVVDKAGGDQNGTAGTGVSFDTTYKAFTFDGTTNGVISDELPSTVTGAYVHSMSLWFKHSGTGNTLYTLVHIGDVNNSQSVMSDLLVYDTGKLRFGFYDNDSDTPDGIITLNQWYHVVATYSGGTGNANSRKIYVNGKEIALTLSGANNGNALSLPSDPVLYLGSQQGSIRLTGSIANFRLYSKALNAGQVQELYDYQKDYFLGSKSQVTLYKGHLGVGVTEPSGQLELAGDERLQEYPPGPMDGYETLIPGHGVFCAYVSSNNTDTYAGWKAFNKVTANGEGWMSKDNTYDENTGVTNSATARFGGRSTANAGEVVGIGEWLNIDLPYKIHLKQTTIIQRKSSAHSRPASSFTIWGSNDKVNWDEIISGTSTLAVVNDSNGNPIKRVINTSKLYSSYRYQVHGVIPTSGSESACHVAEWRLFGTPGPTTLDKGDLSLTRSISNLPMIKGSDYEVPKFKQLRMYLNTDTDPRSGAEGSGYGSSAFNRHVYDISYNSNHAVLGANVIWDPNKQAMYFNGSTGGNPEVAYTSDIGFSGDREHSVSLWFWSNDAQSTFGTNEHALYSTGNDDGGTQTGISLYNTFAQVWRSGGATKYPMTFNANQWNHLCMTYSTGGSVNSRLWLNGVELTQDSSVTSTSAYSFNSKDFLVIGDWIKNSGDIQESYPWHGYISNFKLWGGVLTQEDALTEYKRGRVAKKTIVMSDVHLGVGCNPSCHLDVMGNVRISGGLTLDRGLLAHQTTQSGHITVCGKTYKMTSGGTAERVAFLRMSFPNTYGVGVVHVMGTVRANNSGLQSNFHYMIGLRGMVNSGVGRYDQDAIVSSGYMSSPSVIADPGSQVSNDGNFVRTINFEFNTNAVLNAGGTYCVWTAHCEYSHPSFSATPHSMW